MDRCNLAVLDEPGQEDLVSFLAEHKVHVVASMPCYLVDNVDKQRGKGTYDRSVNGLRALNAAGYGNQDDLPLHLVYNFGGPSIPPSQEQLEADYRERLRVRIGAFISVACGAWPMCRSTLPPFPRSHRQARTL